MTHPFGTLLVQHLHRKPGLSQMKLATDILLPPATITWMCQGKRLTGPQARERVLAIIGWLHQQGALSTLDEANGLLTSARMAGLADDYPREAAIIDMLASTSTPISPNPSSNSLAGASMQHRTNLPHPVSSFVGRDRELRALTEILETTRLVTLTGSGGCGKTRLAVQVVTQLHDTFSDGIWFVDLAPVAEPSLLPQVIAEVLGIREQSSQPLYRSLCAALELKHICLILDNCEHLIPGCTTLIETLLHACPHLTIFSTSREALRIPGEVTWRISSLAVPPLDAALTLTQALTYASVQLFVARAQAVDPSCEIVEQDVPAIVTICRSLDGIPLALELAAARLPLFSVDELAARLNERFELLTYGSRTALPRHQTLRASLDWSYDLLSRAEQASLCRLAIFVGSWTLEAAEAICNGVVPGTVLQVVGSLVDKSLILAEQNARQRRYRLLETIRQYATERFQEAGERVEVQHRHAVWYLHLAEQAESAIWGPHQVACLNRLTAELDNLRAALKWFQAHDIDQALCLMGRLWTFWHLRGYRNEGRQWLEETLAATPVSTPASRVKALAGASALAWAQGDHARAQALSREGLLLAQRVPDISLHVLTLLRLRQLEADWIDVTPREEMMQGWLQHARQAGDQLSLLFLLFKATEDMIDAGERTRATQLVEEALTLARHIGGPWCIAVSLSYKGQIAMQCDDLRQARTLFEESLAIQQAMQNRTGEATVLQQLSAIAQRQGKPGEAIALLQQSLAVYRATGEQSKAAGCLTLLATLTRTER